MKSKTNKKSNGSSSKLTVPGKQNQKESYEKRNSKADGKEEMAGSRSDNGQIKLAKEGRL